MQYKQTLFNYQKLKLKLTEMRRSTKKQDQIKQFQLFSPPLKEIQQISFQFLLSNSNRKEQASPFKNLNRCQNNSPKNIKYGSGLTYLQKHAKFIQQKHSNKNQLIHNKRIQPYQPSININALRRAKSCISYQGAKRLLQKSDQEYKQQYEHVFNSLVELQNRIDSKINIRNKQYTKMEEELAIMQGFTLQMKKQFKIDRINQKTKFTKFLQETTPKKNQVQKPGQNQQTSSQKKYANKLFHSNISLNSPSLYLSANSQKQKQGSLLLSFKKSTQRDQQGYQTLKYSQQSNYGLKFKPHRQFQKDQIIEQPSYSYSPVLPYRFQKLQKQRQRETQKKQRQTSKKRVSKSYIQNKNQSQNKRTIQEQAPTDNNSIIQKEQSHQVSANLGFYINTSLRNRIKKQQKQNQIFKKQLQGACNSLQPLTESILHQIAQEKVMSSQNWSNVVKFMDSAVEQLLNLMRLQQQQNLISERKMMDNISYVSQSLSYEIQLQKLDRKNQQQAIMNMLNKIVQTMQAESQQ